MNNVELQPSVLGILESFSGPEPMKKLFWSTLNYNRANKPITRRGWADGTAALLHEDPLLLATGGSGDDFRIVYSRLAENRLLLGGERPVVSRLLKDHPYSLFLFSDKSQTNWHFVNVRLAEDVEKRKLFRRVAVGPNEKMRTASQVVSQLDLSSISPNLSGLSPLKIQERHDQAFDVEPVTEEFFTQYHLIFERVEELIRGIRDKDQKRLFTQRLFNRLMFIAFIQKKGWLQFGGNQDYLNTLWSDYRKNGNKEMGFYYERLYNLFFHGLGAQDDVGISKINRGGVWAEFIGKVPYLNGGLFEEDEDDKDGTIKVPDEAIRAILHELFEHFNFTVTEATPLDIEVAVDPEMLGKVFEELVTGRHETGSYYTPKPIVSFMCQEALKGYLESQLPDHRPTAIASFVDEHDPKGLKDAETTLEALRRIRVCDPACGSGAYLLGMLHELMELRSCLFTSTKVDFVKAYERKLEIIQRNLYGVDLDLFAVNIARLRLWLSLAVEFEGEHPEPLPNLKFEIEEGDSVSAPGPQPEQGLMRDATVREFAKTKALYIKAHGENKRHLEKQVLELKRSIVTWTHGKEAVAGFDWPIEFAEVFQEGGFDIVVANPPYVRQELIKDIKPTLKAVFPEVYMGGADLYVYFYARALQILRPGGMIAFISSNKWFRAAYGEKLRKHIADTCCIFSITDFGELPVFKAAATFPMVFVAQKGRTTQQHAPIFTQVKSLAPPYPDLRSLVTTKGSQLPSSSIAGSNWMLTDSASADLFERMKTHSTTLGALVGGRILYGIKTGFNKAFVLDDDTKRELVTQDRRSSELIHRLAVGDDVRKWRIEDRNRWLIVTKIGVEIKRYPAIFEHLKQWKDELASRCDKGNYWWELRPCDYYNEFDKPRILFPDIAKESRFAFGPQGLYTVNTTYFICSDSLYLLGVLNSSIVWFYCKQHLTVLGDAEQGGRLRFFRQFVEVIPIPKAAPSDQNRIATLVKKCLDAGGRGCSKWEAQIDSEVAALYGITPEELILATASGTK